MKFKCIATACLSMLVGNMNVLGQTTFSYFYPEDMKNYHTLPSLINTDFYAAGTIFPNPADPTTNKIHYKTIPFSGGIISGFTYDVAGKDERMVAFPQYTNTNRLIVAMIRNLPSGRDGLKILITNNTGSAITNDIVIESSDMNVTNMYPMDAIINNNILYICGYATGPIGASQPDYSPLPTYSKKAFVLRYDLATNARLCKTYDFIATSMVRDFDMAMRMKILSISGTDYLYVTGSNNITVSGKGVCGTMNMSLDLSVGNLLNVVQNHPFASIPGSTIMEFGLDIIPHSSGGYFIFGNCGIIGNITGNGFNSVSTRLTTTYVGSNLGVVTASSPSGAEQMYIASGDYISLSNSLAAYTGTGDVVLAGFRGNGNSSCHQPNPPSMSNINPFLATLLLGWNSSTGNTSSIGNIQTYYSNYGTFINTQINSFWALGGGLSNTAWQSKFASRRPIGSPVNDFIGMAIPRADAVPNKLNLKFTETTAIGNVLGCNGSYGPCAVNTLYERVREYPLTPAVLVLGTTLVSGMQSTVASYLPSTFLDCANVYYKTVSNTAEESHPLEATIYPNPAKLSFSINWSTQLNPKDQVTISLYDVTGRKIQTVFSGNGTQWYNNPSIDCSAITPALYIVDIEVNKTKLTPAKLQLN